MFAIFNKNCLKVNTSKANNIRLALLRASSGNGRILSLDGSGTLYDGIRLICEAVSGALGGVAFTESIKADKTALPTKRRIAPSGILGARTSLALPDPRYVSA